MEVTPPGAPNAARRAVPVPPGSGYRANLGEPTIGFFRQGRIWKILLELLVELGRFGRLGFAIEIGEGELGAGLGDERGGLVDKAGKVFGGLVGFPRLDGEV